ncbi:MAG: hypothetical protein Alpg2KO_30390 [Alphaproteobacteria bacterium]
MSTVEKKPPETRPKRRRRKLTAAERAEREELRKLREAEALAMVGKQFAWGLTFAQGRTIALIMLFLVLFSPLYAMIFDRPDFNFTNLQGESVVGAQTIAVRPFTGGRDTPDGESVFILPDGRETSAIRQLTREDSPAFNLGADGLTWLLFEIRGGDGKPLWHYVGPGGVADGLVVGERDPNKLIRKVVVSYPTLFSGGEELMRRSEAEGWTTINASLVARADYRDSPQRLDYIAPQGTFLMIGWESKGLQGATLRQNVKRTMIFGMAGPPHWLMGIGFLGIAVLAFARFLGTRTPTAALLAYKTMRWHERLFFASICLSAFSFVMWQAMRHLALLV